MKPPSKRVLSIFEKNKASKNGRLMIFLNATNPAHPRVKLHMANLQLKKQPNTLSHHVFNKFPKPKARIFTINY